MAGMAGRSEPPSPSRERKKNYGIPGDYQRFDTTAENVPVFVTGFGTSHALQLDGFVKKW